MLYPQEPGSFLVRVPHGTPTGRTYHRPGKPIDGESVTFGADRICVAVADEEPGRVRVQLAVPGSYVQSSHGLAPTADWTTAIGSGREIVIGWDHVRQHIVGSPQW